MEQPAAIFCARCAAELHPGASDFYQVTIEAVADPAPPVLDEQDLKALRREIEDLLQKMADVTAQEAQDQVYRRMILHLCAKCYVRWIENPTG